MSNEQWIIYLYGVWPDKGLFLLLTLSVLGVIVGQVVGRIGKLDEEEWADKWLDYIKVPSIVVTILLVIGILLPNKQTFLLLVATPTIMESLTEDGGKLNRLDNIVDKALLKADNLLDEE